MNDVFLKIVNMSISAGWLILAVLILRVLLKKAPKWVNVLLWGIVAVRLIFPLSIESALSLIPSAETISGQVLSGPSFDIHTGITPVDREINGYLGDRYFEGVTVPANNGFSVMTVLTIVWVLGILLLAAYTMVSYWRLHRKVDTAVRYEDNIFRSENVVSPFILGVIRPKIYLPFSVGEEDLAYVIAHEQAHIRRGDQWWKPMGFILLTLHWFNPLVWVGYALLCRDIELACDERVIGKLDSNGRADYMQTLVSYSVNRPAIAACPLAFGEIGVKERVKSVMRYRKPAFWAILAAVVVCVAVAVCFLTNPRGKSFHLEIVIPAGSQEGYAFADEEICPTRDHIVVTSGDGLGDTEVFLETVEGSRTYAPTYLTPGFPADIEAEKGAWLKIGVNVQNPAEQDMVVYIDVRNVEVRIRSTVQEEPNTAPDNRDTGDTATAPQIAQYLPYPPGYSYASSELQTEDQSNTLIISLDGNSNRQDQDFEAYAAAAFRVIEEEIELKEIAYRNAKTKEEIASYTRTDEKVLVYRLTIGAEGVTSIGIGDAAANLYRTISSPSNDRGFAKGESVYLGALRNIPDICDVEVFAADADGNEVFRFRFRENTENPEAPIVSGDWVLTPSWEAKIEQTR